VEHFVTLFDSAFLPQGLALHGSLERHAGKYTLWILCMDAELEQSLSLLHLPHVRLLSLSAVETPELLRVKEGRSRAEYCWTITPFTPRFVFDAEATAERVTYLDADLWFRKSPRPMFVELEKSGKDVLITNHAYAPEYDKSATSGQYCVQFVTFTRSGGEVARKWWEERCLEWCFARFEDGKFGDQMYLDDWPERFAERVHVLEHEQWTLAPWNATRFPYGTAVLYHFHGLRLLAGRRVSLGDYALPPAVVVNVYEPYLACLKDALALLSTIGITARAQQAMPGPVTRLKRALYGVYSNLWRLRNRNYRSL
jgi:hypothetical protein